MRQDIGVFYLPDTDGLTHGGLDVEGADVLPALLEERNKEVDGENQVGLEVRLSHVDMSDGDTEAENLLKLELDSRLDLSDLGLDIISVRDGGGEHTHLVQLGTNKTRDILDESISGQESIVGRGPLLDGLLLLIELLQIIGRHGVDLKLLCDIEVLLISDDAHLSVGASLLGQDIRTSETLILRGVKVLQTNLKLNRLEESALGLGVLSGGQDLLYGSVEH